MKLMTDNSRDLATVLALVLALAGSAPMVAAAQEPEPEAPGQAEEADPPEGDLVTRYRPKDLRRLCRWRNLTPIYAVAGAVTQGTPGDDCIVGSPGNDTVQAGGGDDIVIGGGGSVDGHAFPRESSSIWREMAADEVGRVALVI